MPTLYGRSHGAGDLMARVGRLEQLGGITPLEFGGGRARGVRGFAVRTGSGFEFTVVADRALDVCSAEYRGTPLVWHGPAGVAAPSYYQPRGEDFARNFFGGLFTTCGLGNFGPPGKDRWGSFGMHGRINHLPAEHLSHRCEWRDDVCTLEITGTMREAQMFGEDLRLDRRLRTELGSSRLLVRDRVTNDGGRSEPHMLLYHCNAGFPLLDDDLRLVVAQTAMHARDDVAERAIDVWDRGGPPDPAFAEQVFIHQPRACADGRAGALFVNRARNDGRGLALSIRFDPMQLPAIFSWRMLGVKTYVMAVEPANCPTIEGRVAAGERGTLPMLEPGETRTYELEFEVLDDPAEIDARAALLSTNR
ncbi:MAG: aldose 1-epimerase family protein [Vulcanimicrobiaceae bacterium]